MVRCCEKISEKEAAQIAALEIRGVLLDKDGTLVDFLGLWGPTFVCATYNFTCRISKMLGKYQHLHNNNNGNGNNNNNNDNDNGNGNNNGNDNDNDNGSSNHGVSSNGDVSSGDFFSADEKWRVCCDLCQSVGLCIKFPNGHQSYHQHHPFFSAEPQYEKDQISHAQSLLPFLSIQSSTSLFVIGRTVEIADCFIRVLRGKYSQSERTEAMIAHVFHDSPNTEIASMLREQVYTFQALQWNIAHGAWFSGQEKVCKVLRAIKERGYTLGVTTQDEKMFAMSCLRAMKLVIGDERDDDNGDGDSRHARVDLCSSTAVLQEPLVVAADEGYGEKPHPGMVFRFASVSKIDPRNICIVGDSVDDMKMAFRSTVRLFVGILSGVTSAAEFDECLESLKSEGHPVACNNDSEPDHETAIVYLNHISDLARLLP
eukprot:ANDGO_05866.mRNA.1 hypothetical protein